MRKLSLCFACCFILFSLGCGSTSGDPTARVTLEAADTSGVLPGGSTVITATVIKTTGTSTETTTTGTTTTATASGWGENVTFKLLTANGARLSILTQKTDGDGKARTVYTAGNNYNEDIIQATLDNEMSASVVVKKTGTIPLPGASIALTASPVLVKAFGYSTIQATVKDGDSKPLNGAALEFRLAQNNSGAALIVQNTTTDAAGQAMITYRAGGNEPSQDVVQAKLLSNGAVSSVIISVTGGKDKPPFISVMTATPASVKAGQQSKVVIKVIDSENLAVAGEQVIFTINPNNSGSYLIIQNSYTDAQGQIVATYVAGKQSPLAEVNDTVQAQVVSSGSVNSVIITVPLTPVTVDP